MPQKLNHVCYLTQAPGPYREPLHEVLSDRNKFTYSVVYCAKLEPNRSWNLDFGKYSKYFLSEKSKTFSHNNRNVWALLNKLNPTVLIITGFSPTMLYGVIWTILKRRKLIIYNDGTYLTERNYSKIQKLNRWWVFKFAKAYIGTGKGSYDLYRSYGVNHEKIFTSCLCIDNSRFDNQPVLEREFDIMYAGQITERKLPLFFADVAIKLKQRMPNLKVLIVGDGPQREDLLNKLNNAEIANHFTGFLDQKTLSAQYSKSKLFLFTTMNDVWGVVANEACASGTPVITSMNAGVANELIIHNKNGYILDNDVDLWTENILALLKDETLLAQYSNNALRLVEPFNYKQSADGITAAVDFVIRKV